MYFVYLFQPSTVKRHYINPITKASRRRWSYGISYFIIMEKLLEQLEQRAVKYYGGHYTIFRFTTNWKVCFGTAECRDDIDALTGFKTLKEALIDCLLNDTNIF